MTPVHHTLSVGPGFGYSTIGEAVDRARSLSGWVTITIAPGVYREKLFIERAHVRLVGTGPAPEDTMVVWDDYARKPLEGRPMRTFNTATLFAGGDGFSAENLTFANSAGLGSVVGQAVAAYVDADQVVFRRCRFLGRQDTLFTGPLPPDPKEAPDFGGPRDTGPGRLAPKHPGSPAVGHQLYEDCLIEGDIDFVFGSAEAIFRRCEVRSLDLGQPVNGWVSAASTPRVGTVALRPDPYLTDREGEALERLGQRLGVSLGVHGHLFVDCSLTASPSVAPGSVYLGRPWRDWARTIYLGCHFGPHIHPSGWDDWGKASARDRCLYLEVDSTGPGASVSGSRTSWCHEVRSMGWDPR